MSNYDFLLDHTDFSEESTIKTGNEIIVRGYFYGSDDLSWTKYEYRFTKMEISWNVKILIITDSYSINK